MSDHDGQNIEASALAERESREIQEMKREIEVLRRTVEEQKLRAERDVLHAEVARGAEGGRSGEASEGFYIVSCCANIWAGSPIWHVATFSVSCEMVSTKPPKFDDVEARFGMWRSKFQALFHQLIVYTSSRQPITL